MIVGIMADEDDDTQLQLDQKHQLDQNTTYGQRTGVS